MMTSLWSHFDALALDDIDGESKRCKDREADGKSDADLLSDVKPFMCVNTCNYNK